MIKVKEKIKRIKVDAAYGKKKHFNAADRKENYHLRIGIPLIIINIIIGTVLFYVLTDSAVKWVKYIPISFAFIASLLSGFQTYFNFNEKVESHRRIGNRYLSLMKKCDRLEGYIDDGIIENAEIIKRLEELGTEIDLINTDAESYPTSKEDYEKARIGIESGEEFYTEKELKI